MNTKTKKCEEPELTIQMRARLNDMYALLKTGYCTKQFLMEQFNLGERSIRQLIEIISHRYPVISSSSNNKGYKIATEDEDWDAVDNTARELSNRIDELEKRLKPLMKFRNKEGRNLVQRLLG